MADFNSFPPSNNAEPAPPAQPAQSAALRRPERYTEKIGNTICDHLIDGVSLRKICQLDGMPDAKRLFKWTDENDAFKKKFERAKNIQLLLLADDIIEISKTPLYERRVKQTKRGQEVVISDNTERSRLMIESRKYVLAKLMPKVYGDKPEPDRKTNEQLEGLFQALMAGPVKRAAESAGSKPDGAEGDEAAGDEAKASNVEPS